MNEQSDWRHKIEPHWSEEKLEQILSLEHDGIRSRVQQQSSELKKGVKKRTSYPTDDVLNLFRATLRWENGDVAICLWSGHIKRAEEERGDSPFDTGEGVESSLVERLTTPYSERENNIDEDLLIRGVLPIMQSSAIAQLRPDFWSEEAAARRQIREYIQRYTEYDLRQK